MHAQYEGMSYKEIRAECKEKKVNAKGSRDELINRLLTLELEGDDMQATDPNPKNPNYDLAGRWRRRPLDFLHWREDGTACCVGDEDDPSREK